VRLGSAVLFLLVATAGFGLSRAGLVDLKYAAMNPIRDRSVRDRVLSRAQSDAETREYLTRGSETAAETLYIPPVPVLKVLALAQPSALADLLFVRAHAYFLSHFFADRIFAWLDQYYEAIVGLDPDNPKVYLWAGQVVKYGQHIDDDTIRRANAFLEAGLARFPEDWRLHMELGFNLYFEFRGKDEAEQNRARLRARDHFATAAGLPGAPIDPNFVAELFERGHEGSLAIAYALQRYFDATEDQRRQLLRRISVLSGVLADQIREEEARYRREFPFIPPSLFALVRGRAAAPPAEAVLDAMRAAADRSSNRGVEGITPWTKVHP